MLAVLVASCATSDGKKAENFSIHAYQSGGLLPDSETTLQAVLDLGKPVVLNFWAGDCPPCRAEMPTLEASWRQYGDEMVMLGVDIGPYMGLGTFESGQQLLEQTGITYPAGNAPDASFISDYNLLGLPMTFFLLPDGTIQDSWTGGIRFDQLDQRVTHLISAARN
jgi:cytochrome c-type biogenesis protein